MSASVTDVGVGGDLVGEVHHGDVDVVESGGVVVGDDRRQLVGRDEVVEQDRAVGHHAVGRAQPAGRGERR